MNSEAKNIDEYILSLSPERRVVMEKLNECFKNNLPKDFAESMSYGMPTFIVPLSLYPAGYHCKKGQPLPFLSFASQKNYIAIYHLGLYLDRDLISWFKTSWSKHCKKKLDMGKSCIRLKDMNNIPYDLFAELAKKITVQEWISMYETSLKIR